MEASTTEVFTSPLYRFFSLILISIWILFVFSASNTNYSHSVRLFQVFLIASQARRATRNTRERKLVEEEAREIEVVLRERNQLLGRFHSKQSRSLYRLPREGYMLCAGSTFASTFARRNVCFRLYALLKHSPI